MKTKLILLVAFSLLLFSGCVSVTTGAVRTEPHEKRTDIRLRNDVVPIKYELSLWADPNSDGFSGQVAIDLQLLQSTDHILLHGKDLQVLAAGLLGPEGDSVAEYSSLDDDGLARVSFAHVMPAGNYRLEISYRGKYQDDLNGLYRVKDGNDHYLFTQFEPLSARKMLPCFDEPRFKTPFDVKVITKAGNVVIANSREKSLLSHDGEEVHIFATTKPMSTYLLALAVGPFDVIEATNVNANNYRDQSIPLRGIATRGKGEKLRFALKETPNILLNLEQYFGVAYPYDKLDIIAVPDFSAGAMENIGAITFRETYLLLDEKSASEDHRRNFYEVTAHELAHQWFGNLVTMAWWDDIWLNEAFATWLSHKIVDKIQEKYKSASHLLDRAHYAMGEDSLRSARKIREPIVSTHDIHNAFDSITYLKGGAVLSMLENYLGEDRFRDAVSSHIKRFQNGNATSKDFLESLAKFSDSSLVSSVDSFLNQTGVPLVKLDYTCRRGNLDINVEQSRYLPVGSKIASDNHWNIPMCIGYESHGNIKKHCFTFDKKSKSISIPERTCPAFVIPNLDGKGYYRFSLDEKSFRNIISAKSKLNETTRLAIADSLLAELSMGHQSFGFVIDNLIELVDINSSTITRNFIGVIEDATDYWVSAEVRPIMHAYAKDKIKKLYNDLNNTAELTSDQQTLRKSLANFLANVVKDNETRIDLSVMGTAYLNDVLAREPDMDHEPTNVDENIIGVAVGVSAQYQDDNYLERITKKLADLTDTLTRDRLIYGLAKSREGDAANAVRSLVFDRNLRKNERLGFFYNHLYNTQNQPATWNFVKDNIKNLRSTLSKPQVASLPYLSEGLCTNEAATEVNNFFSPWINEYEGGPRTLAGMVEQIELCAARVQHASVEATRYFAGMKDAVVVKE